MSDCESDQLYVQLRFNLGLTRLNSRFGDWTSSSTLRGSTFPSWNGLLHNRVCTYLWRRVQNISRKNAVFGVIFKNKYRISCFFGKPTASTRYSIKPEKISSSAEPNSRIVPLKSSWALRKCLNKVNFWYLGKKSIVKFTLGKFGISVSALILEYFRSPTTAHLSEPIPLKHGCDFVEPNAALQTLADHLMSLHHTTMSRAPKLNSTQRFQFWTLFACSQCTLSNSGTVRSRSAKFLMLVQLSQVFMVCSEFKVAIGEHFGFCVGSAQLILPRIMRLKSFKLKKTTLKREFLSLEHNKA